MNAATLAMDTVHVVPSVLRLDGGSIGFRLHLVEFINTTNTAIRKHQRGQPPKPAPKNAKTEPGKGGKSGGKLGKLLGENRAEKIGEKIGKKSGKN